MIQFFLIFLCLFTNSLLSQIKLDNSYFYEDGISYSITLPIDFDKNQKYYLALGLHGLGGDGGKLALPFSYYTKYMNMILVCPDGNLPDRERNSVKWGYEKSDKYILKLIKQLKLKFNLEEEIFFFGFSQGANQGLGTSLKFTELFKYFAAFSGGYTVLNEKQFQNSSKVNILFLSGDTGDGEVFTRKEMDSRYSILKKYKSKIERKIFNGLKHEVSFEEIFYSMDWFRKQVKNTIYQNQVYLDYLPSYNEGVDFYLKGRFKEAILSVYDSINKNKYFSPNYLILTKSFFFSQDIENFKKTFFNCILSYSEYDFFDQKELFDFYDIIQEAETDFLLKEKIAEFIIVNLRKNKKEISDINQAELNFLLANIYSKTRNTEKAKIHFKISEKLYTDLNQKYLINYNSHIRTRKLQIESY
jgi:predicted esterase